MRISSQNRPARHDKAVFFAVDESYFPYAMFAAWQIARAHPERDFDICIVSAAPLPAHPLIDELGLRCCVLEADGEIVGLDVSARLSFSAYLRILAPEALKGDYRRALYLDADVFYIRGDLSRLLELALGPHPLGAVRDIQQMKNLNRPPRDFRPLGLGNVRYFNSGVLLFDLPRWCEAGLSQKVIGFAQTHMGKLQYHDQSALNGVLMGDWAELAPVWNFQYSHKTALFAGMFDVCLMHFIGRRKPFKGGYSTTPRRFCTPYQRFFDQHFPALGVVVDKGLEARRHRGHLTLVWLLHLFTFSRFLANEARWADEWEVKTG